MKEVLFVGLGRVGSRSLVYLKELVKDVYIYAVDVDASKLSGLRKAENVETHLYEPGILRRLGEKVELAVTALPSTTAFRAILELAGACVNVVDVSFFLEDPYVLSKVVEDCGSTLVVDAGFAPGYSNVVVGYAYHKLGLGEDVEIATGGIPDRPVPPIGYAVTWNPRDLLEEYVRPARFVENGEIKAVKPVEAVKTVEVENVGTFEAFISDGLRTMLRNIKARNLKELTLRWPGHMSAVRLLYELGFLDGEEVEVNGTRIKPVDFTARILEKRLSIEVNDIAVLRVKAIGDGGEYREIAVLQGTPENPATPVFTALVHAYTAKLVLESKVKRGVVAPEELYEHKEGYEEYLKKHGVVVLKELVKTRSFHER
ncbi:MAG: saccharopine dehydrogenase C-terminal domain-containing protein [Desulfurococcaceae archaeon]